MTTVDGDATTRRSATTASDSKAGLLSMALGAIGVVFGDIGTSPIYTLQVASTAQHGVPLDRADTFGVISLIVWSLVLAISVKYVGFVMRADHRGEGGILALLALLPASMRGHGAKLGWVTILVVIGAALLFGDGMVTPAISVLSALEGLELPAPGFKRFVLPLTCGVLLGLFAIQPRGTGGVGKVFGPIMILWFFTIGALGLNEVFHNPAILGALSPHWGARYFARHGFHGLSILGVVVLAITGGEAVCADMGHFGARSIRISWFALVAPALILSYLGQGALIIRNPAALAHPFFSMVPTGPLTYALVALAALATTIASQALISGVFSLTHQAIELGLFPRVTVRHTSSEVEGQVYVPLMNWSLMFACIALVLGFRESTRLASAYGIAVSGTMAITSVIFFEVTRKTWKWSALTSFALLFLFLSFDLPFFAANTLKLVDGGYVPIAVAVFFFVIMTNWKRGHELLKERLEDAAVPVGRFIDDIRAQDVTRTRGVAVYLTPTLRVPQVLRMQVERTSSLAENVILLEVIMGHDAHVDEGRRYEVASFTNGFVQVTLHFGYLDNLQVPLALAQALENSGVSFDVSDATYYVGRHTFLPRSDGEMKPLSTRLFSLLSRNAKSPTSDFHLPEDRVVELGVQLEL